MYLVKAFSAIQYSKKNMSSTPYLWNERRNSAALPEDSMDKNVQKENINSTTNTKINVPKKDTSGALAAKLLAGWTMLEESCPNCHVPLVRQKNKKEMLCVSCERIVMHERDMPQMSPMAALQGPVTAPVAVSTPAAAARTPVAVTSPPAAVQAPSIAAVPSIASASMNNVQAKAAMTLLEKLEMVTNVLKTASTPEQILHLVRVIEGIATSLTAVQNIK